MPPKSHRMLRKIWIGRGRDVFRELSVSGELNAVSDHSFNRQRHKIGRDNQIGAATRRNRAYFAFQAKMLRGVQCRHLDRCHRLQPLRNGMAHDPVHMPIADQRQRVAIIGAKNEVARVEAALGYGRDLLGHIVPRGAKPQHCAHSLTHTRDGIFFLRAFMIVGGTTCGIGVKRASEIARGIVAANGLICRLRSRYFGQHLRIASFHAGEVHHFAKPDDIGPAHGFRHILRADGCAACFEAGRARHAARHLHPDIDGQRHGFVMHEPHAAHSEHIGDLMRIDEHGRGAMRDHRAREFRHRQHAAFDMHMSVAKTGHEIAARALR